MIQTSNSISVSKRKTKIQSIIDDDDAREKMGSFKIQILDKIW